MNEQLLILSWLLPLLAAPLVLLNRPLLDRSWPVSLAAVPALITAFFVPAGTVQQIPWLFLGSHFGLDHNASIFLMFSSVLWFIAGLQAELTMRNEPHWTRFRFFFLLAMSGNFWLILSQDMINFYLGFSLMGLSAYALVIHSATSESLFAGRVYLIMTLLAESALLAGFVFIYSHTGSLAPTAEQLAGISNWAIGFLILGLGIKAGLVFLHVWLPLTYPAAPIPASAVLSGAMIKVAFLGWIRYLPIGQEALLEWGSLLVFAGAVSILFGAVVGLVQKDAKAVLAYSSISKMGFMSSLIGLAMLAPEHAEYIIIAVVFLAAYHSLAKGSLFLGVGIVKAVQSKLTFILLLFPALVLAAAPFTAGSMMKTLIKPVIDNWQGQWALILSILLLASSFATALLMARFMLLMSQQLSHGSKQSSVIALPWVSLIALIIVVPLLLDYSFSPVIDSWPLAVVITVSLLVIYIRPRWLYSLPGLIPAGDMLFPIMKLGTSAWRHINTFTCWMNSEIKTVNYPLKNNLRNLIRFTSSLTGGKS
jgi:formate hydrogenlyase subunit 3/multisubunit Na+/H+ antiporter MnhD subunit